MKTSISKKLFISLLFFVLAGIFSPFFGAVKINLYKVFAPGTTDYLIFWYQRLPRVILGLIAGGGLAVSGASFQGILRNPLATPYTLGMSSAAAFGASLSLWIPSLYFSVGPIKGPAFSAFLFAVFEILIIYTIARKKTKGIRLDTLLLAGIAIGLVFSSGIIGIRYIASPHLLVEMERWLLGGLNVNGWEDPAAVIPFLFPCVTALIFLSKNINYYSFGEEMAYNFGVNPDKLKKNTFFFSALLTSSIVSQTGPIGFVGLIVPHGVRILFGPDFRIIIPSSFFFGGGILAVSDAVARSIIAPTEIPVGLFTSLIGGPVFVILLIRSRLKYF